MVNILKHKYLLFKSFLRIRVCNSSSISNHEVIQVLIVQKPPYKITAAKQMCCHGSDFQTRGLKIKTTTSSFILTGIHLDSLQLFKAELVLKYENRAHGTPVGSEPFLPSIVSCYDMAQSQPPTVFTPFNHTHRQVVSLG